MATTWRAKGLCAHALSWIVILLPLLGACRSTECANGFDEVSGACVKDCGGCSGGQFCDASLTPSACRCPAGFTGEPCVFDTNTGLIGDPDFKGLENPDTGEDYWTPERSDGTTLLPDEPFSNTADFAGQRGVGWIPEKAACNAGTLLQLIEMPSFEQAQDHLVAEVTYQARNDHGLAVGFDRAWTRLRPTYSETESGTGGTGGAAPDCEITRTCEVAVETFCLGEGAYGEPPHGSEVAVRISAPERSEDCIPPSEPAGTISIKRFWIRPANETECRDEATGDTFAFGDVLNADANRGDGGWRFETEGGAEGALAANAGNLGSDGARLFRESGTAGRASMTTKLSVPLPSSMPSPALRFWWRGSAQQLFEVEAGTWVSLEDRGRQVDTLVGTGAGLPATYCLPPWTHGNVLDLSFSLTEGSPTDPTELVVDAVELFSADDCLEAPDLLDPTINADNFWFGVSLSSIFGLVSTQTTGAPPLNGEGNRFLELRYASSQANVAVETYVFVPPSDGGGAPALFFQATSPTQTVIRVSRGQGELLDDAMQTTNDWQQFQACLPAAWAGRWFPVQVGSSPTLSGGSSTQQRVFLDDFSLGTSESCTGE